MLRKEGIHEGVDLVFVFGFGFFEHLEPVQRIAVNILVLSVFDPEIDGHTPPLGRRINKMINDPLCPGVSRSHHDPHSKSIVGTVIYVIE